MRRCSPLITVLALVIAACGGSNEATDADVPAGPPPLSQAADATDPPATDPPATNSPATDASLEDPVPSSTEPSADSSAEIVARSGDGGFGMIVGGEESATDVSIRLLDPDEWLAEVAGGDNSPGVKVYELEPDGATFDEPVMVTRRLDIANFASLDLGPHDVPLVAMLTQADDGTYEMLDDLSLLRVGNDLFVSGTTTHFSPIIVTNENRMIPFGPGEELDPPPRLSEAEAYVEQVHRALGDAMEEGPEWVVAEEGQYLTAAETMAYVQRLVEDQERDDTPFELFVDDSTPLEAIPYIVPDPIDPTTEPSPSQDDAGFRAQRYGTQFPFVPISMMPSAQTLLDASDSEFELTVAVLELLVPQEQLDEVADEIADEVGTTLEVPTPVEFVYEVFHRLFGFYPSSTVKRFGGLQLPPGIRAYSFSWADGPPSSDSRLVAIAEAIIDGDDLIAETGIECFCSYSEGLLLVSGELDPALMDPENSEDFWAFATGNEALAVAVTDVETGQVREFGVSADEGVIFDGTVGLTTIP